MCSFARCNRIILIAPYPNVRLAALRTRDETLNITAQNLIEFWAVVTRPIADNGLGMTIEMASGELKILERLFSVLPETPAIFEEWKRLVTTHRVSGKNTHDARIVAVMNLYGISAILTFNVQDFKRYGNISAVHPATLA